MKKVLTIICMLAVAFGVSAQSFEKDYTYGFWSNWSIGGAPMYTKTIDNNWAFGQGSNIGFDLRAQKQIAQHWDMRIIAEVPGLMSSDTMQFDRYAKGLVGFAWTPKNHFYMFADGGIGVKRDAYGLMALAADAGIGLKWNVCKKCVIFTEAGMDVVADFKSDMTTDNAFVKVGYMYNFGVTKIDQEILATRNMLKGEFTQDTIDKLNQRIIIGQNCEKLLMERIACLEQHDSSLHAELAIVRHENDSLRSVLKDMCDNRSNFYALPFSILFDNNSYVVKASEMNKIKAVASIMNDDTTAHYTIAGFCDHTGSDAYNKKLSEKRVKAVKNALMRYGVKEDQLSLESHGKSKPFSNDKLPVNRRVSFFRD